MNGNIIGLLVPTVGLVSGLIATYVSLQNRALLAEVRKELAELENRLTEKLNGKYVRSSECQLRESNVANWLHELRQELRDLARKKSAAEECE